MITEAIILAGGLGTRLQPVVGDLPKCLAPCGQTPLLSAGQRKKQGIKFICAWT
jgi:NDP-sugar pyrophosphorylase family protein